MPARRRFGSVRRLPSGRWQARYWDAAGNRVGAPTTFATKADAQRWLSAVETDQSRGEWHDPRLGEKPFGEWAAEWLVLKERALAPSTANQYDYLLRNHIVPHFGAMPLGRITTSEVQSWRADRYDTNLCANTVAKAYRLLRQVLGDAITAGLIARNPCNIKGAGTEIEHEMQIATPEQVAAICAAVGPRWEALVFTAAYTGLRWGELAGLRRRDIDLEASTISVTHKLGEVNGVLADGRPKSRAGRRVVGVPSFVIRSLATHIDLYALPGDDGLVFPSVEGTPMRRSNFRRRVWDPAVHKELGMDGFRFHDLRHTAASLAAASGASLKALMARIGHSSVRAALRYQHVIDGQDADIVRYLERFGEEPPVPARTKQDASDAVVPGHAVGTTPGSAGLVDNANDGEQDFLGGDDGTRTHDPLLAKQAL
jgi:integrase